MTHTDDSFHAMKTKQTPFEWEKYLENLICTVNGNAFRVKTNDDDGINVRWMRFINETLAVAYFRAWTYQTVLEYCAF